jgi:hypothetical protein
MLITLPPQSPFDPLFFSEMSRLYVSITPALRALRPDLEGEEVEIDEVYTLAEGRGVGVQELLEGSVVRRRVHAPPAPLTELEALRQRSGERRYQRLASCCPKGGAGFAEEVKAMSTATALAGHFILAFVGAFVLGYYFTEVILGVEGHAVKVLAGGGCCAVTMVLEVMLFIIREERAAGPGQVGRKTAGCHVPDPPPPVSKVPERTPEIAQGLRRRV